MKKFLILFLIVFLFFVFGFSAKAQDSTPAPQQARFLEVAYPEIQGISPTTVATPIPEYVKYIYYLVISICGLIALGVLIYGGFRYLTSVGNPEATKDAREQIFAAVLGIVILLSSWLILYNINPQLVSIRPLLLRPFINPLPTGVWLCTEDRAFEFLSAWNNIKKFEEREKELDGATGENKKEILTVMQQLADWNDSDLRKINEKCYLVQKMGNIREDFDKPKNRVGYVYLVPKKNGEEFINYAAILFEDQNFKGRNKIIYTLNLYDRPQGGSVESGLNAISNPSSIIPFVINPQPNPEWKVTTYKEVDYNKGFNFPEGTAQQTFQCGGNYWCTGWLDPSPKSISIDGRYIAILTKDASYSSSEVFTNSDKNLLDNELITDQDCTLGFFRCRTVPATTIIFLISGDIY
jgi:hypothetical protein